MACMLYRYFPYSWRFDQADSQYNCDLYRSRHYCAFLTSSSSKHVLHGIHAVQLFSLFMKVWPSWQSTQLKYTNIIFFKCQIILLITLCQTWNVMSHGVDCIFQMSNHTMHIFCRDSHMFNGNSPEICYLLRVKSRLSWTEKYSYECLISKLVPHIGHYIRDPVWQTSH